MEQLPDDTKRCGKCRKVLGVDEFHPNHTGRNGLYSKCKQCCRDYYMANRERQLAKSKAWIAAHPARRRAIALASYHRCRARTACGE